MRSRHRGIVYPAASYVEEIHDAVIRQRGSGGWVSRGMLDVGIEWAKTEVYEYSPFPGVLLRAAAMMYAYIAFHPFADGNKRTALLATKLFLFANGYDFQITEDAPEFTRDLAQRCLDRQSHTVVMDEIQRVAVWLRRRAQLVRGTGVGLLYRLLSLGGETLDPMSSPVWKAYFQVWLKESAERIKEVGQIE